MSPSAVVPEAAGPNGHSTKMPSKTRELNNHHMDSTVWNDVKLRSDDIVIATYAKSGTTWVQQIVSQLIHRGDSSVSAGLVSPWVDLRIIPREVMIGMLEGQTNRRFMKTHLPLDAMRWDPDVKYIYIARDGRDMIWSAFNHFTAATPAFYEMLNVGEFDGPKLKRPSDDPRDLFLELIQGDGNPDPSLLWPFWHHIRSWYAARNQPNLLLLHFNDLKADLDGEMRKVAKFLGTPDMSEEQWKAAVEHCTFDWMKAHADTVAPPQAEVAWVEGAKSFVHKGTNCRWKESLSAEDCQQYEERAVKELGEECANWLKNGSQQ